MKGEMENIIKRKIFSYERNERMNNILIGNGFDIEIGGVKECSNAAIIERVHKNIEKKDYKYHIKDITASELKDVIEGIEGVILKDILSGKYNSHCETEEERSNLKRFVDNYDPSQSIGMEDYFLILRLFHKKYGDSEEMIHATAVGLEKLFLDAIFNEGELQKLYMNLSDERKLELQNSLNKFDNIYTINYDWNIEKITNTKVKHLHGQFDQLNQQFREGTALSKFAKMAGIDYTARKEDLHLFCNAIMGFSGGLKEKKIKIFTGLENNDEYYYNEFKNLKGTMSLAGMSPNNDGHIMRLIFENKNIDKVIFYYHSEKDKKAAKDLYEIKGIICKPVSEIW